MVMNRNNNSNKPENREARGEQGSRDDRIVENRSSVRNDLPDSPEDRRKLEGEEATLDLPDVKDIPGQEHVIAPPLGELGDDTIASADEEGDRVFENASDDRSSNVSPDERHALERTDYMPTRDEDRLQQASMDNVDFDGEPLNEAGFGEGRGDTVAPNDLDTNVEGADEPDGDVTDFDDEENKTYSLGSGDNDNVTEGTP